jgi:hypothetical protein
MHPRSSVKSFPNLKVGCKQFHAHSSYTSLQTRILWIPFPILKMDLFHITLLHSLMVQCACTQANRSLLSLYNLLKNGSFGAIQFQKPFSWSTICVVFGLMYTWLARFAKLCSWSLAILRPNCLLSSCKITQLVLIILQCLDTWSAPIQCK